MQPLIFTEADRRQIQENQKGIEDIQAQIADIHAQLANLTSSLCNVYAKVHHLEDTHGHSAVDRREQEG